MSDPHETPPATGGSLAPFTPVPRKTKRADGWRPELQRAFIEALANTGSVASACRVVGRSEGSAYALRRHPEAGEFRAAWLAAQGHGILRLQDAVVIERALNGVDAPLIYHGEVVGTYRKFDNRLAAFILRNHLPEQYGEDGGRRPHAIDAKKLEAAKKEWQAERDAEEAEHDAANLDFIAQIKGMHLRWWADLGPRTRAAYIHFRRLERIEGRAWLDEAADLDAEMAAAEAEYREVFANDGRSRAKLLRELGGFGDEETCPDVDEGDDVGDYPPALPPPDSKPPAAEPRIRTLKDDGWR